MLLLFSSAFWWLLVTWKNFSSWAVWSDWGNWILFCLRVSLELGKMKYRLDPQKIWIGKQRSGYKKFCQNISNVPNSFNSCQKGISTNPTIFPVKALNCSLNHFKLAFRFHFYMLFIKPSQQELKTFLRYNFLLPTLFFIPYFYFSFSFWCSHRGFEWA